MKPITYLEVDWIENDKLTKISEKDVYIIMNFLVLLFNIFL